jgi:hypothetical protein
MFKSPIESHSIAYLFHITNLIQPSEMNSETVCQSLLKAAYKSHKILLTEYINNTLQIEREIADLKENPLPAIQQLKAPKCDKQVPNHDVMQQIWDRDIELCKKKWSLLILQAKYNQLRHCKDSHQRRADKIENGLRAELIVAMQVNPPMPRIFTEQQVLLLMIEYRESLSKRIQRIEIKHLEEIKEIKRLRHNRAVNINIYDSD